MKVLHVVPNPFYLARGGLIRVAQQIAMAQKNGVECHVVTYHLGQPFGAVPLHRIPEIPWYRKLTPGANIHRIYLDLLLMMKCHIVAKRLRPDIIHAHLHEGVFAALPYAKMNRTPLLLDAEGSLAGELRAYKFPGAGLFSLLEYRLNRAVDMIVTSSLPLYETLRPVVGCKSRIAVLGDCVDTDLFYPQLPDPALKQQLGIKPGAPVAVYLGSLDLLQGMDLLMQVALLMQAILPSMRFLIMGGPGEAHWKARFLASGIRNCTFTGAIDRCDAPLHLALGDVAISLKRSASLQANGKLLDYMAMGLPVVAFDTPGNREILGDGGVLVSEGNGSQFAENVAGLIKDSSLRQELSAVVRARAQEYFSTTSREIELLEIYRSLTKTSRLPA